MLQIVTIPGAIYFKFKFAYIATYCIGFLYSVRFRNGDNGKEKQIVDTVIITLGILGILLRVLISSFFPNVGLLGNLADLITQYIKLIQGAALFIILKVVFERLKMEIFPIQITKGIIQFSGWTYVIYIVHEFFVNDIFTQFLPQNKLLGVVVAWVFIGVATAIVVLVERKITKILQRIKMKNK